LLLLRLVVARHLRLRLFIDCPQANLDVMRDPINQTQSIVSHSQHLKAHFCLQPLAAASDRFTSSSLLKSSSLNFKE